jgi:Protein of unknown function (DUF2877)
MLDAMVQSTGPLAQISDFRGTVHAVFPTAIYIAPSAGRLLVIHDRVHGHTPTSLLIDAARPVSWDVGPGDAVAGRLGFLRVGIMMLDARHARVWRPRGPGRWFANVPEGPLATYVGDVARDAFQRLDPACRRVAAALATGLLAHNSDDAAAACRALVGTGPGLTPSGDDALVGLLAVLHWAGPDTAAGRLRQRLAACIRPLLDRTTIISAHYLRLALDGHVGEHLTNLLDDLGPDGAFRPELVTRVLATGATSGADALIGVVTGLRLLNETASTIHFRNVA